MMKALHKSLICLLLLALPVFSSCDRLLDCAIKVRPKLSDDDLPNGKKGQNYSATITGSVSNGSSYDATYSVSGSLPQGIGYSIIGNEIHFNGAPLSVGTSVFKVNMTLGIYTGEGDEPCNVEHETSRQYSITVKE